MIWHLIPLYYIDLLLKQEVCVYPLSWIAFFLSRICSIFFFIIGMKYEIWSGVRLCPECNTTDIYTPTINGNAKPTHIVRLVASLSSSIKQSGPQKDWQID